jgi:tetratricopeptide (TPR) repeat protein
MTTTGGTKKQLALVYGTLPTVEEIDQFLLLASEYDVTVVASESVCGYLTQTSYFNDLRCVALPEHADNTTYLPGLEKFLGGGGFDVVVVKERLGMYAFQAVKAKWRSRFRLVVWVDNATPFPGEDIKHMRTIRTEVSNAADAFLVQSEAARAALLVEGIEPQRIMAIKPWVEARATRSGKARAKAAQTLGLGDTDFIIAHFGQIEWEEGLFDLVHAVKLVDALDKTLAQRIKIVLCGIGSFSSELRDRLVKLGLDRQAVYVAPSREAFETVLTAADCMYYAPTPARDRLEAEPYRLVSAVVNQVPVLAARHAIVEELIGKHRLDFCSGSADSLARAIRKAAGAPELRGNVANKCASLLRGKRGEIQAQMSEVFSAISRQTPTIDISALDHQVLEAETLVASKQYLAAIDLIESVFKVANVPVHHRANLLRLIADCFTKLGDGESGKNAYIQSIELDPYSAKPFIGLGTVALTRQSYETAVPHFQKAVSLAPEDEMANLGLGLAFQGMAEHDEASRWVTKALQVNPENTAALFTLVQLANERERFGEVEAALEKYCTLHPQDHNMVFTLAAIKHRIEKNKEAKALVDRIIAVDPYDDRAVALEKQISRVTRGFGESSSG